MNRLFFIAYLFFATISSAAFSQELPDSAISVTDLNDLIVEGKRSYIESDRVVYIPTRKEKNLSNSPESLLTELHSPLFYVQNDIMKDINGNDLIYYINGEKATDIDIVNFRTTDVIRVEYMPDATDPKYNGAHGVVNFIMQNYEYGGVAKIVGNESFIERGNYSASAKMVYKSMTYGVLFNGSYLSIDGDSQMDQKFDDIWYNGVKYENLSCEGEQQIKSRNNQIKAAFSASYRNKGSILTHTLGFARDKYPKTSQIYHTTWSPHIFNSSSQVSEMLRESLSPQISGNYILPFTGKFTLYSTWSYIFNHNNRQNTSTLVGVNTYGNGVDENLHKFNLSISPTFVFSQRAYIQPVFSSNFSWYDIRYSGTYDNLSHRFEYFGNIRINAFLRLSGQFYITVAPGFSIDHVMNDGVQIRSIIKPLGYLTANWTPSSKFSLYCSGSYSANPPVASRANDAIIRESELMWVKGNLKLPQLNITQVMSTATWMPSAWPSGALHVRYLRYGNYEFSIYQRAPKEMGGLIRQSVFTKCFDDFLMQLNLNVSFLKGAMSIYARPSWKYQRFRGVYASESHNTFVYDVGASYRIRNFGFNLTYSSGSRIIDEGGQYQMKTRDNLGFSASYGNGDIYVVVGMDNITHKKERTDITFSSPYYCYRDVLVTSGRKIFLTLSYTIGYGKRVDRNIDISAPSIPSSGAL